MYHQHMRVLRCQPIRDLSGTIAATVIHHHNLIALRHLRQFRQKT